jgi:hypothetical protein
MNFPKTQMSQLLTNLGILVFILHNHYIYCKTPNEVQKTRNGRFLIIIVRRAKSIRPREPIVLSCPFHNNFGGGSSKNKARAK